MVVEWNMRVAGMVLAAMGASGCQGRLIGDWSGDCVIDDATGIWEVAVALTIDQQRSGEAVGQGALHFDTDDLRQYSFEGPLDAAVDGDDVDLRLQGVGGGYLVILDGAATLDGDDIDGDCTIDYIGDAVGTLRLDR